MALALVRVDDRLIHGQVVAIWVKALDARRIIIVDDETARDAFIREVIALAAPPGIAVETHDLAAGIERLRAAADDETPTIVLLRSPITALRLRQAGIGFGVLNLGGLGTNRQRSRLYRNIAASEDELDAMRQLERLGTRVEIRIVESDRAVPFSSIDAAGGRGRAANGGPGVDSRSAS